MTHPDGGRRAATIWLEPPADPTIDQLRRRFDPQHRTTRSHVTIVYPTIPAVSDDQLVGLALGVATRVAPFVLTFRRWIDLVGLRELHSAGTDVLTAAFPAFSRAAVVLPDNGAEVLRLRAALQVGFQAPEALLDHPPFLTIGQAMDSSQAASAARALGAQPLNVSIVVSGFTLLREDAVGDFATFADVVLTGDRSR